MNYHLVSKYLGHISIAVGVGMLPSFVCALLFGEYRTAVAFAASMAISLVAGFALWAVGNRGRDSMHQREAIALVGFTWFLVAVLGAFPYIFSGVLTNPADALFESMSGFTTTGATVLQDIEAAPKSILFWRNFTQWLGGIGIVVLFIAVLPRIGAGGKQLFKLEVPGPEHPAMGAHVRDSAKMAFRLYAGLSVALAVVLMGTGLSFYESLCHTFSTVSTGGFSTRQASIASFDNALLESILIAFMVIASVNFTLYFALFQGRWRVLWANTEWRTYMVILIGATLLITLNLAGLRPPESAAFGIEREGGLGGEPYVQNEPITYPAGESFRKAAFQVVSISTSSGFVTDDFDLWPDFSRMILVTLMVIGGCGGSTAGGFKVIRIVLLVKMAYWRLEKMFRPKTVRVIRVNGEVVEEDIQQRLFGFFGIYLIALAVGTLVMTGFGLPFQTATSAVIATLNNIGPGLALIGATMDYSFLSAPAKLFLSFYMVLGRLELFTICALLMPSFWRSTWIR